MAVGTVSAIEQDNWQLITTNTPSAASSSTFSGISGYQKLMVVFSGTFTASGAGTNTEFRLTFNSDTTAGNYGGASVLWSGLGSYSAGSAYIPFTGYTENLGASSPILQYGIINNANSNIPKKIELGGSRTTTGTGMYIGNAITSISLAPGTGTITGSFYLYGIAA
jgi:hypothetical protein